MNGTPPDERRDPAAAGPETERDPVGDVPPPATSAPETVRSRIGRILGEWGIFAAVVLGIYGIIIFNTLRPDGSINYAVLFGVLVPTLIYGLFALGLNLQFGFTGLINFGHVGSMVVGTYVAAIVGIQEIPPASPIDRPTWLTTTIATLHTGLNPAWLPFEVPLSIIGVFAGILAAVAFGLIVGLPTLRLREDYLAIVTISAAEILRIVVTNAEAWTGGTRGIYLYDRFAIRWVAENAWLQGWAKYLRVNAYELFLALLLLGIIIVFMVVYEGLTRAPYGRVLKAIRDDEEVAASIGKNVFVYKLQVLVLGSVVGAVAGSVLAWWLGALIPSPELFGPIVTFYAWIAVIAGGAGNNKGTLLGAVFLWTLVFEGTRYVDVYDYLGLDPLKGPPFRYLFIGMLLIAIIMLRPQGILGRKEEMVFGK